MPSNITNFKQLTGSVLKQIATELPLAKANAMATLLNDTSLKYGLANKTAMQCFLATVIHESGEFSIKEENMNYTTAARIVAVWPSRFNLTGAGGKRNANDYTRNPQKLANVVYNGRMGNRDGTNDGYAFRGSGFIQLTGRESFERYAKYRKENSVEAVATKLRTDDSWAMDSAFWEFVVDKKLTATASAGDFQAVTKRINGGLIGWDDRLKYFKRAQEFVV